MFEKEVCIFAGSTDMLSQNYQDLAKHHDQITDAGLLPVVYSTRYNISFFGLERLHPFDPCKFAKIVAALRRKGLLNKVLSKT